jgi:NADH:ubiquinone oxidoreductase subunit 6 (subunit J)
LTVAFAFLAGMTLVSALGVVLSRNVVHSALFMAGSFLGVAGYFVMLNAPVLAAFQVLIYVGAVTVVILFGIMFTQKPQVRRYRTLINRQSWGGFFVAAGVGTFPPTSSPTRTGALRRPATDRATWEPSGGTCSA